MLLGFVMLCRVGWVQRGCGEQEEVWGHMQEGG